MGHRHRYIYYMTGLPGWMRFGFSPGWLGRSPTGLPPTAQWLMQSGLLPQYTQWLQSQVPPAASPTTPPVPPSGAPVPTPFAAPFPTYTEEQEKQMMEQQVQMLEAQLEAIRKRLEELSK